MSKQLAGESPGWHVVNEAGAPVSGPWVTKADGQHQTKRKGPGHAPVFWNGKAVVVA